MKIFQVAHYMKKITVVNPTASEIIGITSININGDRIKP